jgi:hypothetical protein
VCSRVKWVVNATSAKTGVVADIEIEYGRAGDGDDSLLGCLYAARGQDNTLTLLGCCSAALCAVCVYGTGCCVQ